MSRALNVLVVEDDEAMQLVYSQLLSAEGHAVAIASEGREALSLLTADLDLIVTDLNMPGMAGDAFINALRRDPRFGTLPVLVITAHPGRLPEFLQGPWTSVIRKPFRIDLFTRFVETVATRAAVH
jgi:CheY-like chemotaxis protein